MLCDPSLLLNRHKSVFLCSHLVSQHVTGWQLMLLQAPAQTPVFDYTAPVIRSLNLLCGFPQNSTVDTTHPKNRQFLPECRISCRVLTRSLHGINFHTQICCAAVSGSALLPPCSIFSLESGLWFQGRARYYQPCCSMSQDLKHEPWDLGFHSSPSILTKMGEEEGSEMEN